MPAKIRLYGKAFDPAVPSRYDFKVNSLKEALAGAHGLVLLSLQNGIELMNLDLFRELMTPDLPFIVDTKNFYDPALIKEKGFRLERL